MMQPKIVNAERLAVFHLPAGYAATLLGNVESAGITPWHSWFTNIAIGMMNRGLGQITCKQCNEIVPHERVSLEWEPKGMEGSGWRFQVWRCPDGHRLLTKDSMHIYAPAIPKVTAISET